MGSSQRSPLSSDSDFLGITSTLERHNDLARGRHPLLTGSVRQPPSRGSRRPAPSTADESWHPEIQPTSGSSAYPTEASSIFDTPYHRPARPISISEETDATSVLESDTASVQSVGEAPGTDELTIPCEFSGLSDCGWTFRLSEIHSWLTHVKGVHLRGFLPDETWCWFCDKVFKTTSGRDPERAACFHQRISHIVDVHLGDVTNVDQLRIRPDFPFLVHLAKHGLISQEVFDTATQFTEVPKNLQQRVQGPPSPKPSPCDVVWATSRTNGKRDRIQKYHN
jgi:hypothetical protein